MMQVCLHAVIAGPPCPLPLTKVASFVKKSEGLPRKALLFA